MERIEDGETDPSFVASHRGSLEDGPEVYRKLNDEEDGQELYRKFNYREDGCTKVMLEP